MFSKLFSGKFTDEYAVTYSLFFNALQIPTKTSKLKHKSSISCGDFKNLLAHAKEGIKRMVEGRGETL